MFLKVDCPLYLPVNGRRSNRRANFWRVHDWKRCSRFQMPHWTAWLSPYRKSYEYFFIETFKCFNRFHPISHSRLWEMQILFISIPSKPLFHDFNSSNFIVFMFLGITLSVQEKNSKIKREIAEVESEINKHGRLSTDYYHKRKKELSDYVSVSVCF